MHGFDEQLAGGKLCVGLGDALGGVTMQLVVRWDFTMIAARERRALTQVKPDVLAGDLFS